MAVIFDRIVFSVPDLTSAVAHYRALFGIEPVFQRQPSGDTAAWWGLSNTVLELVERSGEPACISGLVVGNPQHDSGETKVENVLDLDILLDDTERTAVFRDSGEGLVPQLSVDHVVLRTNDALACIDLFTDQLGIRLALDKTVPKWGGRMLFFRAGKMTLEVIASDEEEEPGTFWGIAYQCSDLNVLHAQLNARAVAVSAVREGRKPGTQVATLKSNDLSIPTLLIQPVDAV